MLEDAGLDHLNSFFVGDYTPDNEGELALNLGTYTSDTEVIVALSKVKSGSVGIDGGFIKLVHPLISAFPLDTVYIIFFLLRLISQNFWKPALIFPILKP